jgi:hypothetical protein
MSTLQWRGGNMKDWVFYMGFAFAVGSILFVFLGLPFIAYLGFTRKLKFLPPMGKLLEVFPNALEDMGKRPPYNKLDTSTAMGVLYFELLVSLGLIKLIKFFKRDKRGVLKFG